MPSSPTVLKPEARSAFFAGAFFMFLAVLLGAFGAHALKKYVDLPSLEVWETGIRYQLVHAVAFLAFGAFAQAADFPAKIPRRILTLGVMLFSFNCYSYTVTGLKVFALVIPVGGTLMLIGWVWLMVSLLLKQK
jgi:uncharacterized membrane protein YgdD (TMEM256/DUF423 family)